MTTEWWNVTNFPALGRSCSPGTEAGTQALTYLALKENKTFYDDYCTGCVKGDPQDFIKMLLDTDPELRGLRVPLANPARKTEFAEYFFIAPQKFLWISHRIEEKSLDVQYGCLSPEWAESIEGLCEKYLEKRSAEGRIYVMVQTQQGIMFNSLGVAAIGLSRDNYIPSAMDDYDHIVMDLKSVSPCGRVVVMNGLPGTGKTFLIRALLDSCPQATFVMIQPHMVPQLADPGLVSSIMGLKRNRPEGPIVFVVEDADSCLATRSVDNISAISAILNFGDGIFGSMLDVRIIATTNAKAEDLDDAIVRPGRLCRRLDLGELDGEQAKRVYLRLTDKELKCHKADKFTLAEIYRLARQDGWKPAPEAKKLGFTAGGAYLPRLDESGY